MVYLFSGTGTPHRSYFLLFKYCHWCYSVHHKCRLTLDDIKGRRSWRVRRGYRHRIVKLPSRPRRHSYLELSSLDCGPFYSTTAWLQASDEVILRGYLTTTYCCILSSLHSSQCRWFWTIASLSSIHLLHSRHFLSSFSFRPPRPYWYFNCETAFTLASGWSYRHCKWTHRVSSTFS